MLNAINTLEFDELLAENYIEEDKSNYVEFKHDGKQYITESTDEDDLYFLSMLNELD